MKLKIPSTKQTTVAALLGAATLLAASSSFAADEPAAAAAPEKPFVTGALSLVVDSHFISYGQDVWTTGDAWNDPLFHPSLELNMDLGGGFTGIIGTWWDCNDNAISSIGDAIQEVDVWIGASYSVKNFKFTALYQEWMYASQNERIIDFKIGYAHWLNPSATLHTRVAGAKPFSTGVVGVLGIAPSKTFGPVTFSVPVSASVDSGNYHGGDAGFGFATVGVSASIPLSFMRGNWSFTTGVAYYHTNDDVIPGNPDSDFLTGSSGITLAF